MGNGAVRRCGRLAMAMAAIVPTQAITAELRAQITVTEVTSAVGLQTTHTPDFQCIPPGQGWMPSGLAVGDFNKDGWPDVFVLSGGLSADRLFINDGDGTFTDRATQWGIATLHGGSGAAVGDFNKDGWPDIYVTSFGPAGQPGQAGKHKLYKNSGTGSFTEVAVSAGVNYSTLNSYPNGYGSSFGDYDLDGDLDLFVTSWKDNGAAGNGGSGNRLFKNNNNGTFTDVTPTAIPQGLQGVWGFQSAFADMNGDHYPELLIAADFETSRYLVNNGNGTFSNFTFQSGTGLDDNGMGQTIADFDRDGLLDWYVTSIHMDFPPPGDNIGNMLYMNQGNHVYAETSDDSGVNDGGWGWGTIAVDLDNDGWIDIVEVNGRNAAEWANELEYIYQNLGGGKFATLDTSCGLTLAGDARAIAWLDADKDGDQDFVISVNNGALRYYRNDTPNQGDWIRIHLSTVVNPYLAKNGYGATVKVLDGGITWVQYMSGSPSYLATSEQALHFGLGDVDHVDEVQVHWPRGQVTILQDVLPNQILTISAPIPADVTANGVVNVDDLLAVINAWGACPGPCPADVNASGVVNVDDLLEVINHWG